MKLSTIFLTTLITGAFALPSSAALVGYYTLDGNFADSSGNGNDGTFFGGTSFDASAPAAVGSGMSVKFDGAAGTYGSINHGMGGLALTKNSAHTVSMWVLGEGTAQADDRVFSEAMTTDGNPLFNVGTKNDGADGTVDFFFRNGGSPGHLFSNKEPFDGSWHHLAWVGAPGVISLYVDGEFDRDFDYSANDGAGFAPDTTTIGGILRATDCCNFTGNIDDVGMWDHALSAGEIAALSRGASPAAIPEPSSALLGLGGLLLVGLRRRR